MANKFKSKTVHDNFKINLNNNIKWFPDSKKYAVYIFLEIIKTII